jgi:hypothetical protein
MRLGLPAEFAPFTIGLKCARLQRFMNPSFSSLLIGLSGNSFVMGKVAPAAEAEPAAKVEECSLCGGAGHRVEWAGAAGGDVVFLLESDSFQNSKEQALLSKICEAMKLPPNRVEVLVRSPGTAGEEWAACMPFQWKELKLRGPSILIVLGTEAGKSLLPEAGADSRLRGVIHQRYEMNLLVTEDLAGMIQNPDLKKQAWEDLKLALKIMKV